MKTIRLLSILCLLVIFIPAYSIKPKTETTNTWMRITDVERTDSNLRIGVRLQNFPHYWVMVDSSTRLIATEDTTLQYKLIASENIELDKKIWMPESGQHEGVLIFEKVPADIKVVDMVESDPADIGSCTYGIMLDHPDTRIRPNILTLSDIIESNKKATEVWNGLDPKRYDDLKFYDKDGMTHIRGRITDYSPRYGVTTFSIRTMDDFTGNQKINVGNINPDGTFTLDIPLTYPQFDYFKLGGTVKDLFLIPGDTLSITTCMASGINPERGHEPEFFGYEGEADDAVVINMLADSLYNRYGINSLYKRYKVEATDSMKYETYKVASQLAGLLDSVYEDLPRFLGNLPVSTFAKDMLSISVIGHICCAMEDIQMDFMHTKGPHYEKGDDGNLYIKDGETLDENVFLRPWMKHKDLIYNNPILVCQGWVLPNRWKFNSQFRSSGMAADGFAPTPETISYIYSEDLSQLYENDLNHLDSIGLGNCFVAQLVRTVSLIENFHTTDQPSSSMLNRNNRLVSNLIKHNEYEGLNEILMSEYNNFVKDVMIAENKLADKEDASITIPDSPERNILAKIIDPYKGNVLFLDFWGIGCGPCRAGMVNQKPLLEKMADKPFRALYIANADEGMEACKKWLRNEEIKGEHIFVTNDDWQRLTGLFNFSAIPFGVLINKEGKILKTHYHIQEDEPLLTKALDE